MDGWISESSFRSWDLISSGGELQNGLLVVFSSFSPNLGAFDGNLSAVKTVLGKGVTGYLVAGFAWDVSTCHGSARLFSQDSVVARGESAQRLAAALS